MELPNDIIELKQFIYTLIDEIVSLKSEITTLKSKVASLEKENVVLRKENVALRKENTELKQENVLLKIEISELKARLNQNSSNSSKPPSSDYFSRKPAFPKTSFGKKGGQSGHKGDTLKQIKHQDAVLAYAFNEEVPFTNNQVERDLRPAKLKLKISNCFRTEEGAEVYARIESFVLTARKHNKNIFKELKDTFVGQNYLTLQSS